MINIKDYYLHSIIGGGTHSLKKLDTILSARGLMSKSMQKKGSTSSGYNRPDEICLVDPTLKVHGSIQSALLMYVSNSLTFMIDRNIDTYEPFVISGDIHESIRKSGLVTDLYDEVRTTDKIGLEAIKGIIIPVSSMYESDLDYLLFSDNLFNFLIGLGVSDFSLSSYAAFHQNKVRLKTKRNVINKYTDKVVKILKKHDVDIPIYDYDKIDQKIKRLV